MVPQIMFILIAIYDKDLPYIDDISGNDEVVINNEDLSRRNDVYIVYIFNFSKCIIGHILC